MSTLTPSIVLDVYPTDSADLRRRLQASSVSVAQLPGGLLLEESDAGATYHMDTEGSWTPTQINGEWHFKHPAGHTVTLGAHGLVLRPAK